MSGLGKILQNGWSSSELGQTVENDTWSVTVNKDRQVVGVSITCT